MYKDYESKYHRLEQNYWWFKARRKIILQLTNSNFKIERASYWNFFLFFPTLPLRILTRNYKNKDSLYKINSITNKILFKLLLIENKFLKYYNFPTGISVFAIVKK